MAEKAVKVAESYNTNEKATKDVRLNLKATQLRKWEVEMPFDNISIGAFYDILVSLNEDNVINFDQLKEALRENKTFYDELCDRESATSKILLSEMFAEGDSINFEMLGSLALLYCQTNSTDTPKIFYKIL